MTTTVLPCDANPQGAGAQWLRQPSRGRRSARPRLGFPDPGIELVLTKGASDKLAYSISLVSTAGENACRVLSTLFTILLMWCGTTLVLDRTVARGELLSCYALLGDINRPVADLLQTNKIVLQAGQRRRNTRHFDRC